MIEHPSSRAHFQEYFRVIRSRFWVIFTIFILTVLSGTYVTEEVLPKIYTASSQLEVKPRGLLDVTSLDSIKTDGLFDPTNFQAEFEIMQSPRVLAPVITKLGLNKKWAQKVFKMPSLTDEEALDYMNSLIHVEFKKGTDIIVVTASDEDAHEAADIANGVVDSYKEMRDSEETQRNGRGADSIRQQIVQQQAIVDDRRAKVDQLRDEAGKKGISIDPREDGRLSQDDTDLQRRESDLLTAKEDADARRVLVQKTEKLSDDEFVNTLSAMNREEKNIGELRTNAFKLSSDIQNLLNHGYQENHPSVLALKAELDTTNQQIKALIAGIRQALVIDSQMADSRVGLLTSEVDALRERSRRDQNSDLGPYRDAQHEYEKQQSLLDAYNIHLKQVIGDSTLMESPVRVISRG